MQYKLHIWWQKEWRESGVAPPGHIPGNMRHPHEIRPLKEKSCVFFAGRRHAGHFSVPFEHRVARHWEWGVPTWQTVALQFQHAPWIPLITYKVHTQSCRCLLHPSHQGFTQSEGFFSFMWCVHRALPQMMRPRKNCVFTPSNSERDQGAVCTLDRGRVHHSDPSRTSASHTHSFSCVLH